MDWEKHHKLKVCNSGWEPNRPTCQCSLEEKKSKKKKVLKMQLKQPENLQHGHVDLSGQYSVQYFLELVGLVTEQSHWS